MPGKTIRRHCKRCKCDKCCRVRHCKCCKCATCCNSYYKHDRCCKCTGCHKKHTHRRR